MFGRKSNVSEKKPERYQTKLTASKKRKKKKGSRKSIFNKKKKQSELKKRMLRKRKYYLYGKGFLDNRKQIKRKKKENLIV